MRPAVQDTEHSIEWCRLFREGHEEGFDYYFRLYYPSLCYFASGLISDFEHARELAATSFMKTWDKRNKFNSSGGIRAYLYRVTRNDCYKWIHQHRRELTLQKELKDISCQVEESHLELVLQAEVLGRLHREMQQLPTGCRRVFEKLYIEGKTVTETARELKLAITTVKTQKTRGLAVLRKNLDLQ